MSYARHTRLALTSAASQVVSSVPVTDDILITYAGLLSGGGPSSDKMYIRPNSDSGTNYFTNNFYVVDGGSINTGSLSSTGMNPTAGGSGWEIAGQLRLAKVGDYWLWTGSAYGQDTPTTTRVTRTAGGMWNSGGVTLSSIQFRWDVDTGTARFTGSVEVWTRDT